MRLEEIASVYGMNDYYDNVGMKIYQLSKAIDDGSHLMIPVQDFITNQIVGYVPMAKQK